MTVSFWQRAAREPALHCDVAVVGGGVLGCATAFWLREARPSLRVAIVEAARLGHGASGRNAGFILQGTAHDYHTDVDRYGRARARRLWHLTRESRMLLDRALDPAAFHLEASGSLVAAGTEEEDERLRASVPLMRADGLPAAYLPPSETNRRIRAQGFFGSLYVPSGAMLDPLRLVRHLAERSQARVLEHHPVLTLTEQGGGGLRVETPGRQLYATQVVLALGAYLPRLYPELGRYVRPVRAQMLATEPAARWLPLPVYSHQGYFYLRQDATGCLLAGGARHLHTREETGYEDATTPALQADLERYLRAYFPQARTLDVRHRWSGTMGFSPDGLPVAGEVPGVEGSYWATGFTGHGMSYGLHFGRLLAGRVLGLAEPEALDLFTAARFERAPGEQALR